MTKSVVVPGEGPERTIMFKPDFKILYHACLLKIINVITPNKLMFYIVQVYDIFSKQSEIMNSPLKIGFVLFCKISYALKKHSNC